VLGRCGAHGGLQGTPDALRLSSCMKDFRAVLAMAAVSLPVPMIRWYTHPMACTYDKAMLHRTRISLMTQRGFGSYTMPTTQMTFQGVCALRDVTSNCLYASHIIS